MVKFQKIVIFLKDAGNHEDYNKRILEYLTDRHKTINDNGFTIAIEIVDSTNINDYILSGVESLPALQMQKNDSFIYGVNSILATLAKLEIPTGNTSSQRKQGGADLSESFYDMALKEMKSEEQEDDSTPSSVKPYHQDLPETPINDKMIEEKTKAYNKIYEERKQRDGKRPPRSRPSTTSDAPSTSNGKATGTINVNKYINAGGFDVGEELLMRQMASGIS